MPKYPEFKSKPIKGLEEDNWGKLSSGMFNRSINVDWKEHQSKRLDSINFETRSKKYARVISQFDKQGNFIKDWESCRKAALELGFKQTNINAACLGKLNQAYGFIWKFKLEQN